MSDPCFTPEVSRAASSAALSSPANHPASSSASPAQGEIRERVLLRVYDLGQSSITRGYNSVAKNCGAFHTGVQIYGREWSFGMTMDNSTGITWCSPGQNPDHSFREVLSMGYTQCSPDQVARILQSMRVEWRGCTYNVLARNCHNFSDEFCKKLGVGGLPDWVNTLADSGHQACELLHSRDTGASGGSTLSSFFSGLRQSLTGAPAATEERGDSGRARGRQPGRERLCAW
mmetsp:Transcript_9426/g.25054  ORF Transcript_9426/g.25054 Transcript_9426/m.25054 type:complete len:231 (+) Transcript_9426:63-755(+)